MKNCPQLLEQKEEIAQLQAQLEERDVISQRLQNQVIDLQAALARRPEAVSGPDPRVAELRAKIQNLTDAKVSRETIVGARDEAILWLKAKLQKLETKVRQKDVAIGTLEHRCREYTAAYKTVLASRDEVRAKLKVASRNTCYDRIIREMKDKFSALRVKNNDLTCKLRVINENYDITTGRLEARIKVLRYAIITNNETFRMKS